MKNRMIICFFLFTVCLFYLSVPNVVFGQSLAKQVFNKYPETFKNSDVQKFFPSVLRAFQDQGLQDVLSSEVINRIANNPTYIRSFDPNVDDSIVVLLTVDTEFKALFKDEDFHAVLQNPTLIEELAKLIGTPGPTTLTIVSGNNQHGNPNTPLLQQLVVVVKDQKDAPLADVPVIFEVVLGNGKFSGQKKITDKTDMMGKAKATLTLGSDPGIYQVEAKVVGFPSLTQTFTAAATGVSEDRSDIAPEKVTISEIMFASKGNRLPQWIELNNSSDTDEVDLEGWTLEIHRIFGLSEGNQPDPLNVNDMEGWTLEITTNIIPPGHIQQYTQFTFPERSIKPQETLLIASNRPVDSSLKPGQVYVLDLKDFLSTLRHEQAFYLKLSNKTGELVDEVGNFNILTNRPDWSLPESVTEDDKRASMIRRHDDGAPRPGTEERAWISAIKTRLADGSTAYYGHSNDIGAPGIKGGRGKGEALPVQLSSFRAERTDAGVAITWSTESELDNAGFTIRRSKTQNGVFQSIHARLILGAGTTGEKNDYMFVDTTAEPGVIYYYQIEDISFGGVRQTLATTRLRGDFSAKSKFTTTWGSLKGQY